MRHCLTLSAFVALAVTLAAPASAATLNADPRTFDQVFAKARSGDILVLAPGDYAPARIAGRRFAPALTLDAGKARITGLELRNVEGLVIRGGEFRTRAPTKHPRTGVDVFGSALRMDDVRDISVLQARIQGPGGDRDGTPFGDGYGVLVLGAAKITVDDGVFSGFKSGVVLARVEGFHLARNRFTHMRSDGIQVAESRRGLIEGNTCGETRIRDQEHPDCIQLWSRPTSPPTADVVIRGNRAQGKMQGIGLFNHVRNGVDDGGFDRITIEDNVLTVSYPHAVALTAGRDSIVRNNKVATLADARWRASINIVGGERVSRCGNVVAAGAGRPGVTDPRCAAE
jgi:hypothetical protein